MAEEKNKFQFLKSLKNSFLNDPKETSKKQISEDLDNVLRPIELTTVIPTEEVNEPIKYSNISDSEYLDVRFAENFASSGGKFIYCENMKDFFNYLDSLKKEKKWNHVFSWNFELLDYLQAHNFQLNEIGFLLDNSDVAMSYCFNIAADEGVILLSPEQATNRRLVNFPETHIIIAFKNQLKTNVTEAISGFDEKFNGRLASLLELHEGKPVTKENHKILLSADGTKDVYLFYIDLDQEYID